MKFAGWEKETFYKDKGAKTIVGIDEVGRGCWAGPLVACAYTFNVIPTDILVGDSKTLSSTKRAGMVDGIKSVGKYGLGEVTAQEIDSLGLQVAQYLAYDRALQNLDVAIDVILLDGREVSWRPAGSTQIEFIIDGDAFVASIAAASIIAKQYRDTYMQAVAHAEFPLYGFDKHVGYGTKVHQEALASHGITNLHRMSYKPIKKYYARKP